MTMRLTVVTETYPPEVNGVAMTIGYLVQGMRQRGHQVEVIRPRQADDPNPDQEGADFLVPGAPLPGYSGLRLGLPQAGRLRKRWRQQRPDLVHVVTEGPLGWSALAAARSMDIPVTSGFHTNFDHYSTHYGFGWMRPMVSTYLRTFHRRALATLVPTEALAATLAGEGIPGVRVVGRGIDLTLFSPSRRNEALRQSFKARSDATVCINVGRIAPEKNLSLAEMAFASIENTLPGARMVWVGDGPSRVAMQERLPQHHFVGVQRGQALAMHYASADLFLFPSLTETYGNVVAEAMASGLAVVAYRSAAASELIQDGVNGVTVSPGDQVAFVAAARRVAGDVSLRKRLASQACASVQSRSWNNVLSHFEAALNEVRERSRYQGPDRNRLALRV